MDIGTSAVAQTSLDGDGLIHPNDLLPFLFSPQIQGLGFPVQVDGVFVPGGDVV